METALCAAALWMGVLCVGASAESAPRIQFDQTVYDFGSTSHVDTVSGTFKFKNVGGGILKLESPKPSCGCTIAGVKPDTLEAGERGELAFTLNLGRARARMEKHIAVKSNDPQTPEVKLTIKVDYTPLYDISPLALAPNLPLGVSMTNQFTTITRTDGKPLRIFRLEASKPWISAKLEPELKADDSNGRIRVDIRRDGPPRRFNEYVHVYVADQTNSPVASLFLYGQIVGEISLSPETLHWSVTDSATIKAERPEAMITRRLTILSTTGKAFELKNPQSTLQGINVTLVPKDSGKVYELVARLNEVPTATISGNVSFETSLATQPRIEVPMIVSVFKP